MRGIFIIILISIFFSGSIEAQDKKAFKSNFLDAEYFFQKEEYEEAAFIYNEMLKSDPFNANLHFLLGACYLSMEGSKIKAIPHLEAAVSRVSPSYREGSYRESNAPKTAFFALGKALHINGQFEEAIELYEQYKNVMKISDVAEIEFVNKHISSAKLAESFIRDTIDIDFVTISDDFNPLRKNYRAVFAEQDSLIVFTTDKPFYTAVMSTRMKNGIWTEASILNGQLEIEDKFKICSISPDGLELYFSIYKDSNWDLYVSYFENGRWTAVKDLGKNINTRYNETHASISSDKKLMYFTSDKPGGVGALDIYSAERDENGDWHKPVNLGKPVNGIYSEDTPFITSDGKTLYFSSMSHATMGGFDVFYSGKLPTGEWSYPANLGYPISTCDDDLFYVPLGKGEKALFTPEGDDALPKGKILAINLNPTEEVQKYTFKGKISTDDRLGTDSSTIVNIVDADNNIWIAELKPDSVSGIFTLEVPPGNYKLTIQSDGYESNVEFINILQQHRAKNIELETRLKPEKVVKGEYALSKNLLFNFDSYKLNESSKLELEKLYLLMTENPFLLVEVTGFTDALGSDDYNRQLAHRRAEEVIKYLTAKGISKENFISKAAGKTGFIAENIKSDGSDNPEGRKYNRRVEINLVNNTDQNIILEDLIIPEILKPPASRRYYVIIDESLEENKQIPAKIADRNIELYKTGKSYIYAAGIIPNREDAIDYLNTVIDNNFSESRIITEKDFDSLIKQAVPDLSFLKGPFTIQLLALKNPIIFNNSSFSEDIRQIKGKDGIYRYITGIFRDYEQASAELPKYVNRGYTDVFVNQISRYLKQDITDPLNIDFYYTIQLVATKTPVELEYFKNIEDIMLVKSKDGLHKYSSGMFTDKNSAEEFLEKIKKQGFKDAFLFKSFFHK